MNTEVRDNLRYLKGLDGTVQMESGVEVTGTAAYVLPSGITTTQRDALTGSAGMVVYNSSKGMHEGYGTAWREVVEVLGTSAQGDVIIRTGTGWDRLAAGPDDDVLTSQGAGANPAWEAIASKALKSDLVTRSSSGTTETDLSTYDLPGNDMGGTGGLRVTAWGTANFAGAGTLSFYLGTSKMVAGLAGSSFRPYQLSALVKNINATAQRGVMTVLVQGAGAPTVASFHVLRSTWSEDTTGTLTIKTTAQSGSTTEPIAQWGFYLEKVG
jgi:hypothetical protein